MKLYPLVFLLETLSFLVMTMKCGEQKCVVVLR